jgi:hypothetical protein
VTAAGVPEILLGCVTMHSAKISAWRTHAFCKNYLPGGHLLLSETLSQFTCMVFFLLPGKQHLISQPL